MHTVSQNETIEVLAATRHWLEQAVIGLNLCPFAKAVHIKQQIRYVVSGATTPDELQCTLMEELRHLHEAAPDAVDTTLLIHPWVLADFSDYLDFLEVADAAVEQLALEGEIQIASFHPHYQFAGTDAHDITNYTNRAPYPILHLLREASVERATDAFPDASRIYERNMEVMRTLGPDGWEKLMRRDKNPDSR